MRKIFPIILSLLFLCACSEEQYDARQRDALDPLSKSTQALLKGLSEKAIVPGRLIVKLKEDALDNVVFTSEGAMQLHSVPTPLQKSLNSIGTTQMVRLFPPAGKYEARTRAAGLHRWMVVTINPEQNVIKAMATLLSHEEFEYVEPDFQRVHPPVVVTPVVVSRSGLEPREPATPFDDPMLGRQWHYHNTGKHGDGAIAGADINLFQAWQQETGKPNVIVCVVDGGVDLTHEDLATNILPNVSYNFVYGPDGEYRGDTIYTDEVGHGTHVAGTVAAVNNNGKGGCGVAGGNGKKDSGIRMFNAQIFGGKKENGSGAAAIKYGADHGAVISQNSWGYKYPGPDALPQSDKEAIDYFIRYAGCDEYGKQLPNSPMKGGIVIFAGGNEGMEYDSWPGAYSECVAVSAMAWDFLKASYSNRGNWMDIMAPGGDQDRFGTRAGVLSTMPKSLVESGYAFMQGTSMACPHVSGIAALMVSKFGKQGFTCEELKSRLLSALRPYDIYAHNRGFEGKLGVGYIDATVALEENAGKAPETPRSLTLVPDFTSIHCQWTVSEDKDATQRIAAYYQVYVSDKALTEETYTQVKPFIVRANGEGLQQEISYVASKLSDGTLYYVAVEAVDRWGQKSKPVIQSTKTKLNHAPEVVKGLPEKELVLLSTSRLHLTFTVADADKHTWTHRIEGETKGVSVVRRENTLSVYITPVQTPGEHSFKLILTDALGKENIVPIRFRMVIYEKPRVATDFDNVIVGKTDDPLRISLPDKFIIQEGVPVKYTVVNENKEVVEAYVDTENNLFIKGLKVGTATIRVEVADELYKVQASFTVRVVENSDAAVYVVYPLPVKTHLKALVNMHLDKITFVVNTLRGSEVLRKEVRPDHHHVAAVNMKKLAPGTYHLTIISDKATYKRVFVKH